MKIDFQDSAQIMSNLLLSCNRTVIDAVIATPQWQANDGITVTAQFNGIEVPGETLETTFKLLCNQYVIRHTNDLQEMYSDLEKEVQLRVEQRLKDEVEKVVEKLHDILNVLEDASSVIKPYWER